MNCFNHTESPAVAQCSQCGKFLCKECATKYEIIICDECAAMIYQEQEKIEQKKQISEKNLFTWSIVLFIVNFLVYFLGGIAGHTLTISQLFLIFISSFLWAGVPYGWQKLNKVNLNIILVLPLFGWLLYWAVKVSLAYTIGWYFLGKKLLEIKNTYNKE